MALSPLKYTTSIPALQTMSNTDISSYIAPVIGADFASTVGVGSLGVGSLTNGTSIGTWNDTYYPGTIGDHPITSTTTTSTTLYQDLTTATGTPVRPVGWNTVSNALQQMPDADIDTSIMDVVAKYIANGGVGAYVLQPTAPASGTWTLLDR